MQNMYPYKVLLVEDEKIARSNYAEYLRNFFEVVYEAEDGESAYKIYKEKKPHILILDINIPKLNGLELLSRIRQEDHATKAIILTAHESIDLLQQAISLKLTKYLVKPISRKDLKESLNLVISELSKFSVVSNKTINIEENYIWNFDALELSFNNNLIYLTKKETKIFAHLMHQLNKTCSIDEIIYDVWDDYNEGSVNALKTIIKTLRKKLPPNTIKNVFGVGYKIEI